MTFLAACIAALTLGCSKDKTEPQPEVFKRTVKVIVTKDVDTKTAVVEGDEKASYVWTEGDDQYFSIYENNTLGEITDVDYSDDMKKATLTVEFNTNMADEYVYKAIYSNGLSGESLKVMSEQSASAASFDPGADVLVSDEITSDHGLTSLRFVFNRVVTVNKMTLKGMTPGEVVNSVEITFNKYVSGNYIYSGNNEGTYSNGSKTLTISYSRGETVLQDGSFPVYFIAMPVSELSLESVVVATDQNNYVKTEFTKTYDFSIGKMTRFGINMSGYIIPKNVSYTLVQNTDGLVSGRTYVIAAANQDKAMGHVSSNYHTSEDATKSGNKITWESTSKVLPVTISNVGEHWTIRNADPDVSTHQYLAWSSGNTCIEQDNSFNWDISVSGGVANITAANTPSRKLQYNSGSPRFACYTSNQQPIALYIEEEGTGPVIIVTSSNPIPVGKDGGLQTIYYTILNKESGSSLSASTSQGSWITNVDYGTYGSVTFNVTPQEDGASARTGSITLNYGGATVVVTISQEPGEGGGQAPTGWLELPAKQEGADFFNDVFYDSDGKTRNYSYHYDKSKYTALWCAYPLTHSHTTGNASSSWAFNTHLNKIYQINVVNNSYPTNYGNSTYSRGHQVPNADRKFSSEMNKATYLMTNQTPQNQNGFNGTIWSKLETAIRALVPSSSIDTVYVVTGATFQTVGGSETINYLTATSSSITPSQVPIPNYYWKVLLKVKWNSTKSAVTSALAIGFWYDHKTYPSNESYSKAQYVKSVNQIEELTGFDFFVNLPSDLEATAENNTSWSDFQDF